MISKDFVVGGKATFTIENSASFAEKNNLKPHYTYKVVKKAANNNYPETWFVSLMTGSDNETSFSYLGILDAKQGNLIITKKSHLTEDSLVVKILKRTLQKLWADQAQDITAAGFEVHHCGKCGRCGRKLTVPESVLTGFGPECGGRI